MGYYFGENDKELLNREVTPLEVVQYLGLDMKKMGSCYSILCPDPSHNDTHFGSCVISKNGRKCHCYVCDKNFLPSSIIELVQGCSFYDAMCQMAELSGHPEDFISSGTPDMKEKKQRKKPLPREYRGMLGLAGTVRKEYRINVVDDPALSQAHEALGFKDMHREFLRDDPQAYAWMVRMKCEEQIIIVAKIICRIDRFLSSIAGSTAIPENVFFNLYLFRTAWNDTFLDLCRIYRKAGGKLKNTREMAGHVKKQSRNFR